MFGRLGIQGELPVRAEVMRRVHSEWLTMALRGRGPKGHQSMPRIPTRAVSRGGFAGVMASARGREWADEFWGRTLERPELM